VKERREVIRQLDKLCKEARKDVLLRWACCTIQGVKQNKWCSAHIYALLRTKWPPIKSDLFRLHHQNSENKSRHSE